MQQCSITAPMQMSITIARNVAAKPSTIDPEGPLIELAHNGHLTQRLTAIIAGAVVPWLQINPVLSGK